MGLLRHAARAFAAALSGCCFDQPRCRWLLRLAEGYVWSRRRRLLTGKGSVQQLSVLRIAVVPAAAHTVGRVLERSIAHVIFHQPDCARHAGQGLLGCCCWPGSDAVAWAGAFCWDCC